MKPGIYSLSYAEYDAIDAVRFSHLKYMATSPLHYFAATHGHVKPSKSMRLGGVAHALTLEPERLWDDYAVFQPKDKYGNLKPRVVFNGKDYESFCEEHAGKQVIKPDDLERGTAIASAILSHKVALRYMRAIDTEQTLVWQDEATGLLCKARVDAISRSIANGIIELKSSPKVDPWTFRKRYADMLYHVQAAWYASGYKAVTGFDAYNKCIAVESGEPHDVVVYDLTEVIDTGREKARELLDQVAECKRTGRYLGQFDGDTEQTMTLPKWLEEDDGDLAELGLEWDEGARV